VRPNWPGLALSAARPLELLASILHGLALFRCEAFVDEACNHGAIEPMHEHKLVFRDTVTDPDRMTIEAIRIRISDAGRRALEV
jgi:hypothetical protein